VLLAGLVAAGVQGPGFYAVALAVVSVNRFFLSSLSASLPHVVSPNQLVTANSLATTLGSAATVTGVGVGLAVRGIAGDDDAGAAVIALTATVSYVVSALAAAQLPSRLLGPDVTIIHAPVREALGQVARGIGAGARHVWHRRAAGVALAAIGAHRFFYGVSTIATLLLYRNYSGFTDHGWVRTDLPGLGQIVAAGSVGAVAAAVATPPATRRIGKHRWIVVVFALAALVEGTLAPTYRQVPFLAAALLLGFAAQASKICVDTIVQQTIDDEFRGRVFAFYDIVFNVAFVSAAALSALLLPRDGKSYAVLALITAGYAATSLGYLRAGRDRARAPVPAPLSAPAEGAATHP
jgi:hypothetical protein